MRFLFRFVPAAASVFVCLASLVPARALANGRYPFAQQLVVDPSDAGRLWLRTTFGLFTSADGGSTWSWICEDAVGYNPGQDPMLAVTASGALLVGSLEGLFTTTDHGCDFASEPSLGQLVVNDLATFHDPTRVLALTTLVDASGAYNLTIYESEDSGTTFHALGPAVSTDLYGLTVDVAPSDDQRVYVSGFVYRPPPADGTDGGTPDGSVGGAEADAGSMSASAGVLLRSKDGGTTFTRIPIPATSSLEQPFIAAVDPTHADVLYVRIEGAPVQSGFVRGRLLYSEDAGDHFREVFGGSADMLGFALAADGSTVYVGLGDSHDLSGERPADPSALGIYRATVPDFTFSRELTGQVGCLLSNSSGLFVCGDHGSTKFELGLSTDDGKSATSLFDWGAKFGAELACPAHSATAIACNGEWPTECDTYGESCPGTPSASGSTGATGGCGCGSPGRSSNSSSNTGTVTLSFLSEPFEVVIAALAVVGAVLRRFRR